MLTKRETRKGWPLLLTVETDANGDLRSTNEEGHFLGWFVGLVVPVQEIALVALVSPIKNIVFPRHKLFQFHCPSATLGRKSCRAASLWICVSSHNPPQEKLINIEGQCDSFYLFLFHRLVLVHLIYRILLGGCIVVWTWSCLEACLFWICIDVIVIKVNVSREILRLPSGEICMDKSHILWR